MEEWIRDMEKIFTVIEVPEEKNVDIVTFYLIWKLTFGGVR